MVIYQESLHDARSTKYKIKHITTRKTTNCNQPDVIFPDKMKMQATRGCRGNKNRRDPEIQRPCARTETPLSALQLW